MGFKARLGNQQENKHFSYNIFRVERQDNDSGSTTTAVNTTAVEVKKTGKRKHEDTDSEEILTKEQSSVHSSSREGL